MSICSVADCDRVTKARGYCRMHYERFMSHGDPSVVLKPNARRNYIQRPAAERFWAKVVQVGPDDCWTWTAHTSRGYGVFGPAAGVRVAAHRFAYELMVGPIPDGLTIDHLCHTNSPECSGGHTCPHRSCVNPTHMEPVTAPENRQRAARNVRATGCRRGHPFTPENTFTRRDGRIACRECIRLRDRRKRRERATATHQSTQEST